MRTTLIATGGTIAWNGELARMLTASELLAAAGDGVEEVVDLAPVPSWDLSVEDMAVIAARVRSALGAGARSIVVAHGTDTMEETAWLTDLMLGSELREQATVLFTGAMRFADDQASDGPANLRFALRAARDPSLVGSGVHVAWPEKLHPARSVRKVDASAPQPFESNEQLRSFVPLPEPGPEIGPAVEFLRVGAVSRPEVPEDVVGLVLEGVGAAHIPSPYHSIVERLVGRGVPVVLATRCRDVERSPDSQALVLYAGDLTAEKAAIALRVGLGRHGDLAGLRTWWARLLAAGRSDGGSLPSHGLGRQ
jgi:L-asparaginase